MSFIPNIEDMAKKELNKILAKVETLDNNHNGISDIKEAEELIQEGFAELKALEAKLTPAEVAAALNVLFPGKFSSDEVSKAEAAVEKIAEGIVTARGVLPAMGITV